MKELDKLKDALSKALEEMEIIVDKITIEKKGELQFSNSCIRQSWRNRFRSSSRSY